MTPKPSPDSLRWEARLGVFRSYAEAMHGDVPYDWEWVGPHVSQRMFGIPEKRAKEYAASHGGVAKRMESPATR